MRCKQVYVSILRSYLLVCVIFGKLLLCSHCLVTPSAGKPPMCNSEAMTMMAGSVDDSPTPEESTSSMEIVNALFVLSTL